MKIIYPLVIVISLFLTSNLLSQKLYTDKYVVKIELKFSQSDYWQQLEKNKVSETELPAKMIVNDTLTFDSVGVRFKGNSSYNIPDDKKSFNISVDKYKNYDLWGYANINLNNAFVDPTFVREKIANEIFSKYLPSLKTGYVALYINSTYWGLYDNVEQIGKNYIKDWFSDSNGNLYKGDPVGNLTWAGSNPDQYKKMYEKKNNTTTDDWSDIIKLVNVINNSTNLEKELPDILDVDRAIWYLALCNIFVNLDSYIFSGHNYYLYNDPLTGQFNILPWDVNETFGTFPPQLAGKEKYELLRTKGMQQDLPLLKKLFQVPVYKSIYLAHCRTIIKESFHPDSILPRIQYLQGLIDDYVKNDLKKLYTYNNFKDNVNIDVLADGRTVPGIISLINKRREYLLALPELNKTGPEISNLQCVTPIPQANGEILFNAEVHDMNGVDNVQLNYRTSSGKFISVEMHDDGNSEDKTAGDNIFGIKFTLPVTAAGEKIEFYCMAVNKTGEIKFEPERAEYQFEKTKIYASVPSSGLVINEFMAGNKSTILDPQGLYDDWIELFNNTSGDISLKGKYLSDDPTVPKKWQFPDVVIPAKGFLIVWADNDINDSPGLHANFKLEIKGEFIGLFDSDENGNKAIDSYSFNKQSDDISEGRDPDGTGNFVKLSKPSPNELNSKNVGIPVRDFSTFLPYVKLFPNPVLQDLVIEMDTNRPLDLGIEIFNVLGKKLFEKNHITFKQSEKQALLHLPDYINGLLFCRLKFANQTVVVPILKN